MAIYLRFQLQQGTTPLLFLKLFGAFEVTREVLLNSRIKRTAKVDGVLRGEYYFAYELTGGLVRAHVGKLDYYRVVGDGHLGSVAKRRSSVGRNGDGDLFLIHRG